MDDPATPDTGVGGPPVVDMGAHEFQPDAGCAGDCDANGAWNVDDIQCFAAGFLAGCP